MLYLLILSLIWSKSFAIALSLHDTNSAKQLLNNRFEVDAKFSLNQYVDQICVNINKKINATGFKTVKLPSSFQEVSNADTYTELFSPIVAFRLRNGSLSDIATFRREGDANITYLNRSLILSSVIKLGSLQFECDADMKLSGFGPTKHISRTLEGFTANITLSLDAATLTVYFNNFDIIDTGTMTGDTGGSSDSDVFANQILYYADSYLQNHFQKVLATLVKRTITAKLNTINNI